MTDVQGSPPEHAGEERANLRVWISVGAALIGAFMAVLNIQITNASLLDIEGGIGTGVDNGAWISTAYLIGEIIVIPLTDYLSRVFSFRIYLIANAALFLAISVACAFAGNLGQMIALRAGKWRRSGACAQWPLPQCAAALWQASCRQER
jgi:DHA2 family multidrug resistance protein